MMTLGLIGLFLVNLLLYVLAPGGEHGLTVIGDVVYILFAGIAGLMGVWAVRAHGLRSPLGKILALLTTVGMLDALGGIIWAYNEVALGIVNPFPSVADVIWTVYYVCGILALILLIGRIKKFINAWGLLTLLIGWSVLLIGVYRGVLSLIISDAALGFFSKFFSLVYPVGDLVLLLLSLVLFFTLRKGAFGESLRTFSIAFALYAVGDLAFSFQTYAGTYKTGTYFDLLYSAAQLFLAYAFYQQLKIVSPTT
jgi:hypothetical protein